MHTLMSTLMVTHMHTYTHANAGCHLWVQTGLRVGGISPAAPAAQPGQSFTQKSPPTPQPGSTEGQGPGLGEASGHTLHLGQGRDMEWSESQGPLSVDPSLTHSQLH